MLLDEGIEAGRRHAPVPVGRKAVGPHGVEDDEHDVGCAGGGRGLGRSEVGTGQSARSVRRPHRGDGAQDHDRAGRQRPRRAASTRSPDQAEGPAGHRDGEHLDPLETHGGVGEAQEHAQGQSGPKRSLAPTPLDPEPDHEPHPHGADEAHARREEIRNVAQLAIEDGGEGRGHQREEHAGQPGEHDSRDPDQREDKEGVRHQLSSDRPGLPAAQEEREVVQDPSGHQADGETKPGAGRVPEPAVDRRT